MKAQICIVSLLLSVSICKVADGLLRVPLTRKVTEMAGDYGQPVVNYYTSVAVGTPGKAFNIQFDVDFTNSFIPHYEWIPFKDNNLHYNIGYLGSKSISKSYKGAMIEFVYQGCTIAGKLYTDKVRLMDAEPLHGHTEGLIFAWSQSFVAASKASNKRFTNLPVDGYFGLAPSTRSAHKIINPLMAMANNLLIEKNQFSILLRRDGGDIIFGGILPQYDSMPIEWHQLNWIPQDRWTLNLHSVRVGQQTISTGCDGTSECQVILSTALSDIYGPRDEVKKLYNSLNTMQEGDSLPALIDCRRIAKDVPSISFVIDDQHYIVPPEHYVLKLATGGLFGNETCYVSVLPVDEYHPRQWTIGTNALIDAYFVFDPADRKVGLVNTVGTGQRDIW